MLTEDDTERLLKKIGASLEHDAYTNSTVGSLYLDISIKTSGMGSLYKLTYQIDLKNHATTKEFIDTIRTRNGNLEIALMEMASKSEEL